MHRPKDIYAPLAVQNWVEYADWLEAENGKLRGLAVRAKVLLDDATYHDGRYQQHTSRKWQQEACSVSAALEPESSTVTGKLHR
jgi:hypothetical protein